MCKYYDGTKLLSLTDANGNKPEIYICTSNRTGGKTTFFGRLAVRRFIKRNEKFMLVYRWANELDSCAESFYKDIGQLFFPRTDFKSVKCSHGQYHILKICLNSSDELLPENNDGDDLREWVECGYAVALNTCDALKKKSHLFSDTACMIMDEFQSESNKYCSNEVKKFISLHTTVARGQGKMTRYVPVYMLSNPISITNPYYTALGISSRLKRNTKFLRGNGWVLEQGYVDDAANAQKQSAFFQAFEGDSYTKYSTGRGDYLNDSDSFIDSVEGYNEYLCTLKYRDKLFSVRIYPNAGILFCGDKADETFPRKIAVTINDHEINYVMLKRNNILISILRDYFEKGCFRFKNQLAKEALLTAISY